MKLADYLLDNPLYGYGQATMRQGSQTTPVQSWQEGLARALQGGVGGFFMGQGVREAKDERGLDSKALADALAKFGQGDLQGATSVLATRPNLSDTAAQLGMSAGMLGYKQKLEQDQQDADAARFGFPTRATAGQPQPQGGGGGNYAGAIAGIESAGQPNGGYGAIGPVANQQGNRAYGKYQVLDSNIPAWTKEILGQEMTPQQFLTSPQAQDAVFKAKFGQYVQQYGSPEAASRAWFAGPGGMNNANAQDVNGMSVGQYGQKFSAALGPQPAGGDTVNFQGLQLPRAALATALAIRDHAERQKAILGVVTDAAKFQREGAPVERIRDEQGNERIVPRAQAAGMTSYQNVSPPGTKEGDVNLLMQAVKNPQMLQDQATFAAVKAAYDRQAQPQQAQSGQLQYPDMGAYGSLGLGAPIVRTEDTPGSRFTMSGKLADDYGGNKTVKDYKEVTPILQSMKEAAGRNDRVADLNLIYGLAKIMDPGSVVREGEMTMVKNTQSLPDWVRTALTSAIQGTSNFTPEQRQRIMREAESRAGALRQQYEGITQQYNDKAGRYGLDPRDVTGGPPPNAQPQQGAPQNVPVYDINGKRVR